MSRLKITLVLLLMISSSSLIRFTNSQALMNQLAVLFRARPPWPTSFSPEKATAEPNFSLHDFSKFNDLLTGQGQPHSLESLALGGRDSSQVASNSQELAALLPQSQFGGNQGALSFSQDEGGSGLGLGPILATSHPLPTLEIEGGRGGKSVLLAHPVLGPNPSQPPDQVDHKFNQPAQINYYLPKDSLYSEAQEGNNNNNVNVQSTTARPKSLAVRSSFGEGRRGGGSNTNGLLQNWAEMLFSKNSPNKFPIFRKNHFQNKPQPVYGKPPAGGKIMAIPIPLPEGSPLLKNGPQVIAVRHPYPPSQHMQMQMQMQHQLQNQHQNQQVPIPMPANLITFTTSTERPGQFVTNFMSVFQPSPVDGNWMGKNGFNATHAPTTSTTTNGTESTTSKSTELTTLTTTTVRSNSLPETDLTTQTTTEGPSQAPNTIFSNSHSALPTTPPSSSSPTIKRSTPPYYNTNHNSIQDVLHSHSHESLPSTVVGTFRYPDPPTKPKLLNMNTRYELPSQQEVPPLSHEEKEKDQISGSSSWNYRASTSPRSSTKPYSSLRKGKSNPKWKTPEDDHENDGFKPSLQVHAFEDTTSGLREYITLNTSPSTLALSLAKGTRGPRANAFSAATEDPDLPTMESGFRPFNHFAYMNGVSTASISTTTESSMMNRLRDEFARDIVTAKVWADGNRKSREFQGLQGNPLNSLYTPESTSFTVAASYANAAASSRERQREIGNSDWVGKVGLGQLSRSSGKQKKHKETLSSTEVYEDWLLPAGSGSGNGKVETKGPKGSKKRPKECDKFHKFGFCPVSAQYPLSKIEKVSGRCSTLLSHLVAPLPKADVRYDVVVSKNRTGSKSWAWKTFPGKPVCDTKEVKILPGWAKNEDGEWLLILQTEKWRQEAQITICTQPTHNLTGTRCVQRFTAQRLVVLDPQDEDRCPVVRSVFLPSACVCLEDENAENVNVNGNSKRSKEGEPKPSEFSGRSLLTSLFGWDSDSEAEANAEEEGKVRLSPFTPEDAVDKRTVSKFGSAFRSKR